jgi:hypothetical protein
MKSMRNGSYRRNAQMRTEYDFRGGIRGKYAARYAEGTNIVRLDADVARAFPTARAVNKALRSLAGARRPALSAHSRQGTARTKVGT